MIKSLALILILAITLVAQELPDAPSTVRDQQIHHVNEWKVVDSPKPSWASRHRTPLILTFLGAGVVSAILFQKISNQHCNHYEYGQNGVNVNCPKDK